MKAPIVKTVLVTGASSGIGKATAKLFAKRGYNVIMTGRREERLQELAHKYAQKYATNVMYLAFDLTKKNEVKRAIKSLDPKWRKIDILVNNAGKAKGLAPIHDGNIKHWEEMIDTNLKGLLYITRLITPSMVKQGSGQVINVCSTAGHDPYPNGNVYAATKFAVKALTQSMAIDLHKHNIKVGQISPGHVETEFALVRFDGDEQKANIYEGFTPLSAKDIADSIFYMATRPQHVNIHELIITSTQQASSNFIARNEK